MLGKLLHAMIACDGCEAIVKTYDGDNDETLLAGTMIGLAHELGRATTAGTVTQTVGTLVVTTENGTLIKALDGTFVGTFSNDTTTIDGCDGMVKINDCGSELTLETATMTGDWIEAGKAIVDGRVTTLLLGNVTITLYGTESGTLVKSTMTTPGCELIVTMFDDEML